MSDQITTPVEPAAAPVVDPAAAPVVPDAAAEAPTHPAWEKSWDEAGIADMQRPILREQVRRTEAAANKAIEDAKAASIDPNWKAFVDEAAAAGVGPAELRTAYNAGEAIRQDPVGFLDNFTTQVNALVAAGTLTRKEGQQAQVAGQQAAVAAAAENDLAALSPQDPRYDALKVEVDAMKAQRAEEQKQQAKYASEREAEQFADQFVGTVDTALGAQGFGDASPETRGFIANMALSLLDGNPQLTEAQAIAGAIDGLKKEIVARGGTLPVVAAAGAAATAPPIGGGSSTVAGAAVVPMDDKSREAAMIAEGLRQAGLGE